MLAYGVLHAPPTSDFPPAPGFVKSFLVPYVFYWPGRKASSQPRLIPVSLLTKVFS